MSEDPSRNGSASLDPRLYAELRRVAASLMQSERRDHTLQPTALVHEAWMRLSRTDADPSHDPDAVLSLAAHMMRRILTDHARRRAAHKRGGGWQRVPLTGVHSSSLLTNLNAGATRDEASLVLDVDQALEQLEAIDPELVQLVSLRFFGGYSNEETARMLGMSLRTLMRRWRFAKAWLQNRIDEVPE